jgi:hypothetical protein
MTSYQHCIYRNKQNLNICKCKKLYNDKYCIKHSYTTNDVNERIYDIIKYKKNVDIYDYYDIYKVFTEEQFIELLKDLSKLNLLIVFKKLIVSNTRATIIKNIIDIFKNTLNIENNSINTVLIIQRNFRKKTYQYTNNEDPFTYIPLVEIPSKNIYRYKENNNTYGFDAVELLYFIEKNKSEGSESYNPYTRKIIHESVLKDLERHINNNNLIKKDINACNWETDQHAYTDLSLIIEMSGFYNSPQWFLKLDNRDVIAIIKLFKFLTVDRKFFTFNNKINGDSLVYYFCKEGIKLFKNYNNNYILCCNFIKAISLISIDFYNNMPEWISDIESSPRYMLEINNFLIYYYI